MLTVSQIRKQLGVGPLDAQMIDRLLQFAEARGMAGRWPDQNFEHDPSWTDGYIIDRTAIVVGVDTSPLFAMYRAAHAEGLQHWRSITN